MIPYPTLHSYILVKVVPDSAGTIIYVDGYIQNINNVEIQRYEKFIIPCRDFEILYQNGSTELVRINNLNKEIYSLLSKYGRSKELDREYIVPLEFSVLFLIRVPSYTEMKKIDFQLEKIKFTKTIITPLLLYNTRTNIELPKNCNIITSIEESVSILSRSPNWIFLPTAQMSVSNVIQYVEEKPYFIAVGNLSLEKLCLLIPTKNNRKIIQEQR